MGKLESNQEVMRMTEENKAVWERINAFAEVALKDIDPQKTQV